ncbi:MAG: glycosyltransferase [Myxococcota bacterium]|nr:glycosyltransferase [Myxococcota bacterium]
MESAFTLSVVIPTYNEEERLPKTLARLQGLSQRVTELEVIISDDGSSDQTLLVARRWASRFDLQLIEGPHDGPGAAIQRGVLAARHDWILLSDADGPVSFETVHRMHEHANELAHDVVSGRRVGPQASIDHPQPLHRRLMGMLWRKFVQHGLRAKFLDPQCGFKLFRASSARSIFRMTQSKSFGIHVETMMVAESLGFQICEFPVSWRDSDGSKIRPVRDSLRMLLEATRAQRRFKLTSRVRPEARNANFDGI